MYMEVIPNSSNKLFNDKICLLKNNPTKKGILIQKDARLKKNKLGEASSIND